MGKAGVIAETLCGTAKHCPPQSEFPQSTYLKRFLKESSQAYLLQWLFQWKIAAYIRWIPNRLNPSRWSGAPGFFSWDQLKG